MNPILVVDDNAQIVDILSQYIKKEGWPMLAAKTGEEALALFGAVEPSLILLDIMLPGEDGYNILKRLKSDTRTRDIPVIMVTAKEAEFDKVKGLEGGADDYITKPFSLAVLRARVNTQLRNRTVQMQKESAKNTQIWEGSIWKFDFTNMRFTVSGQEVELSKTEQKLLALLVQHAGMTVPRETLMDRIWTDGAVYVDENALSVAIKRLRDKLQAKEQIRTVYGIGYVWEV